MAKKDLFQAVCGHYDFINAYVFVFAFGEDEFLRTLMEIVL